ncbi:MAG: flavodoxin family protein [Negativicutes bacterium]
MKKVVAFIGSPRKNGNTAALVTEVVRGAEAAGAQVKVYYLNDMHIRPCQSCFYCRSEDSCIIEDDMKAIYPELKTADAVIIGSPVYMYQVAAQTKILFDRLFPMMDAKFNPRFGKKKTVMVYSQGNPDADAFKKAFVTNAEVLKVMGLQIEETIVCANANHPLKAIEDKKLMALAFDAGKKLVK